jgi:hypothetical protein
MRISHICFNSQRAQSVRIQTRGNFPHTLGVGIGKHYSGAAMEKFLGNSFAQAGGRTRYDYDFIFKHHLYNPPVVNNNAYKE